MKVTLLQEDDSMALNSIIFQTSTLVPHIFKDIVFTVYLR